MKQEIIGIVVIVSITGCLKKDPGPQPKPPIDGKVLSFTDNAPVSGATVVTSKCVEPDYVFSGCFRWQDNTINTSSDGSFIVKRGYENKMYVYKTGFWPCNFTDSEGNAGEVQYFSGTAGLEKIVVKLIEKVKVTVHVKNTSAIADSGFLYFVTEAIHPKKFSAHAVLLRKGIDTTFDYNAFGQIDNRVKVVRRDTYYSYSGYFNIDSVLYSKDIFLAAGSNTSINIQF